MTKHERVYVRDWDLITLHRYTAMRPIIDIMANINNPVFKQLGVRNRQIMLISTSLLTYLGEYDYNILIHS